MRQKKDFHEICTRHHFTIARRDQVLCAVCQRNMGGIAGKRIHLIHIVYIGGIVHLREEKRKEERKKPCALPPPGIITSSNVCGKSPFACGKLYDWWQSAQCAPCDGAPRSVACCRELRLHFSFPEFPEFIGIMAGSSSARILRESFPLQEIAS